MNQPSELTCITFLWGADSGPFGPVHVNRLFRALDMHLARPYRKVCFTNEPRGIDLDVEILPLTTADFRGNLKKMVMFEPGHGLTGRVLAWDLDNVITGSVDVLADHPGQFVTCGAITEKRRGMNGGNLIGYWSGEMAGIWETLVANRRELEHQTQGYERYLYDILVGNQNIQFWNDWAPGSVLSYKMAINKGADTSNCRVVWCHGRPRLQDVQDPWLNSHWKKGDTCHNSTQSIN